jgi:1,4-alpha-glucan branching enzyme
MVVNDADNSVFAWMRKGCDPAARCLVVVNFTPVVHRDYRIRMPSGGAWREILNTDSRFYGGSDVGNAGLVETVGAGAGAEISIVLPPLAAVFFVPVQ